MKRVHDSLSDSRANMQSMEGIDRTASSLAFPGGVSEFVYDEDQVSMTTSGIMCWSLQLTTKDEAEASEVADADAETEAMAMAAL